MRPAGSILARDASICHCSMALAYLCMLVLPLSVGGNEEKQGLAPGRYGEEDIIPGSLTDRRSLVVNEDVYALPRAEIQFLCGHDFRPGFNASKTVEQFYVDEFLSKVRDYDPKALSFEMYEAVSTSTVGNVSTSDWFYPLCNESSTKVLATMEVTGYVRVHGKGTGGNEVVGYNRDKNVTWYVIEHLIRRVHEDKLRDYFHDHICPGDDLLFFHAMVLPWSDIQVPSDQPYHHHKASSWNTNGLPSTTKNPAYDHDLYLLCAGTDDILDLEDEEGPDSSFTILCLIVGFVMVAMLWTELQPPMAQQRRPRGQVDGYVTRPTQEVEMV